MFILYGQELGYDYVGDPQKIAIFSHKDDAEHYINDVTLEIYPNKSRRFRRDSLLGSCSKAWVEKEVKEDLPINPKSPDYDPTGEWIVVFKEKSCPDRTFRVNHGRHYEEAVKEIEHQQKMGNEASLEWRPI